MSSDHDRIYRIENSAGTGLYRVDGYCEWLFSNNDGESLSDNHGEHTDQRPVPTHDVVINKSDIQDQHYGFKNLKQLEDWVGSQAVAKMHEYPDLTDEYRMAIYVYEGHICDIVHGEKQSIMSKNRCKIVDVIQGHSIHKYPEI